MSNVEILLFYFILVFIIGNFLKNFRKIKFENYLFSLVVFEV